MIITLHNFLNIGHYHVGELVIAGERIGFTTWDFELLFGTYNLIPRFSLVNVYLDFNLKAVIAAPYTDRETPVITIGTRLELDKGGAFVGNGPAAVQRLIGLLDNKPSTLTVV